MDLYKENSEHGMPKLFADAQFVAEWDFGEGRSTDGVGGPAPADAGTIYVGVSAESEDFVWDDMVFRTSLREMVNYALDGHRNVRSGRVEAVRGLKRLAAELRELSLHIERELSFPASDGEMDALFAAIRALPLHEQTRWEISESPEEQTIILRIPRLAKSKK